MPATHRRRSLVGGLSLLAALLLGIALPATGVSSPAPTAGPEISPQIAEVGAVGHREKREVAFTVTNPGDSPLPITRVRSSCSCITVEFDAQPLDPGESRSGKAIVSFGRGYGRFHKKVEISIPTQRTPLTLHIRATFHPGVRADKMEVVLDGNFGGGGPRDREVLEIRSLQPKGPPPTVEDLQVTRGEHLSARLLEPAIDRARIEISVAPEHPEGAIAGEVTAQVNGRRLLMPVRGHVFRGIRLSPPQLNFNVVRTAEDRVETIALEPVDDRTFTLGEMSYEARSHTQPHEPKIAAAPRPEGGWTITLTLDDIEGFTGPIGGTLRVPTDHPDKPLLEIRVFGHIPAAGK